MTPLPVLLARRLPWLRGFLPTPLLAGPREQALGALGAGLGLLLTALISRAALGENSPWLIAPMGASAVLLFAVPSSPLAQPWSILAGNLVSALIGVSCARMIPDPALAAGLAGSLAIAAMFALRCLHPPGGAVAVTAALGGPAIRALGYQFVWWPVLGNSLLLLACALLFNNALRRRYPHQPHETANSHHTSDPMPSERRAFNQQDLRQALSDYGEVLDINEEDLAALFAAAERQAQKRRFGAIRCADIMSRDIVTIAADASLQEAWHKLRHHKVKALPVVDAESRLQGMVSLHDFFLPRDQDWPARRAMDEQVEKIMSHPARSLRQEQSIAELALAFSDGGLHHMPVVDEDGRLQGMITQSDLIAALFKRAAA